MKKKLAIHNTPTLEVVDGKIVSAIDRREVRVLAVAEGYAMVCRPGCMVYVARVKELEMESKH